MKRYYKILAERLDALPNGYPATESGVELELLAELFTGKEAEIAGYLDAVPAVAKTISEKSGDTEREVFVLLKGMVRKGLIEIERMENGLGFKLIPFVVGFYENQNGRISEKFARLFEKYYKEGFGKTTGISPSVHRVIPVKQTIPVHIDVLAYENVHEYLKGAKSFGVLDCICRVQKRLIGDGCGHSVHNCLAFHHKENAFKGSDAIETITKEKFIQIMKEASLEGLVPTTANKRDGLTYICNCCTCSCGILRAAKEFEATKMVAKSSYIIESDVEKCIGCGICTEKCQFTALKMKDNKVVVNDELCYGCGVCVLSCPADALKLIKRQDDVEEIPQNQKVWDRRRQENR